MAIGDIPGDIQNSYGQGLTPEQRAARQAALTGASGQSSLATSPISAPPAGPIGRAQQQLPNAGLGSANLGVPGPDDAKQTSFDSTNTPSKYLPPASQPNQAAQPTSLGQINLTPLNPVSAAQQPAKLTDAFSAPPATVAPLVSAPTQPVASPAISFPAPPPTPSIPVYPNQAFPGDSTERSVSSGTIVRADPQLALPAQPIAPSDVSPPPTQAATPPAQQAPAPLSNLNQANLVTLIPQSPQVPPLPNLSISADQYRPTGVGAGAQGGQIVAKVGPNGEPQFSNLPADQQGAQGLGQVSLGSAQGGSTPQPSASLASLGSAGNLGDGVGTFSQAQAGDAALSANRFARANELRQGYANQDRLSQALGAQFSADHTNVVHDSSKQLTSGQMQSDLGLQQTRANADSKVSLSQALLGSSIQNRVGEQQLKQTSSLNDLRATASLPGSTADQQNKYLAAADPKAYLQAQQKAPLTALNIQGKQLENQQKAQSIVQTTNSQQQEQQDRAKAQAGQMATIDQAITSVDSLLGTKIDPKNPNGPRLDEDPGLTKSLGPIDGLIPSAPGTQGADFKARLDTLKAQTFLPQVALLKGAGALSDAEGKKLSDSVGALSTSMSEGAFRKSLSDIRTSFAAARERAATALVAGSGGFAAPGAQPSSAIRAPTGAAAAVLAPVQISTNAAYLALPSGAQYIDPQGNHRSKP